MNTVVAELSRETAGWKYLDVQVRHLKSGQTHTLNSPDRESAIVLVDGAVELTTDTLDVRVSRDSVFSAAVDVLYAPPSTTVTVRAHKDSEFAVGSAPASGRYPARLISTAEMSSVLRGGGPACRQVVSDLADPLPAESLIVYEAWVPRGGWAGWPPHRHDGYEGSPYLEETYYYRFDRDNGFGYHRNVTPEKGLDESTPIRDRSLVAVPSGYHMCAAGPAANMWILNFLAGTRDDRKLLPHFDPAETWINDDWSAGLLQLPAVRTQHPPRR
ncbi:MAG: 5-deoxy-glucuronate isomerase [Mycobacterium sp.]